MHALFLSHNTLVEAVAQSRLLVRINQNAPIYWKMKMWQGKEFTYQICRLF